MEPYSKRDTVQAWVSAAWRAGKVGIYPEMGDHVLTSSISGKTSLIHSLAGELGLDIYVVSLSSKGCVIRLSPSFPT